MSMHVPPGFATVVPYIFADEADGYVRFLEAGLGGTEVGRSTRPDGKIANCQVRFGSTTIMVSEAQAEYPANRAALYLYVEDADVSVARAVEHGAKLEMAVADMPYGDRQGGIVDPSGNIWWISQRLTDAPYF
jgi:PhnB protein